MEHEKDGDYASGWLANHSAGSGPFQIAEFNQGQSIKLVQNEHYSGKKPALKAVTFQIIKDPSAQRLQLEKGDLDIAAGIPMNQLEELKKNKDITIHEAPGMLASVIYLNNKKAPLDNVKFRQALSYAVDYQGVIEGAVKGHGEQLTTPVPKGMWGRDDNAAGYTYDVNKAKELLSQSGVPAGTQLTLLYSDNQAFNETQALILQNNFKAIGIDLKLEKTAWPTFRERVDVGDFELGMGTWSPDYADPQNYMSYWFDSGYFGLAGNRSFYSNPQVDALLREAESTSDPPGSGIHQRPPAPHRSLPAGAAARPGRRAVPLPFPDERHGPHAGQRERLRLQSHAGQYVQFPRHQQRINTAKRPLRKGRFFTEGEIFRKAARSPRMWYNKMNFYFVFSYFLQT